MKEEIIRFMKSGEFCKEFGHTLERVVNYPEDKTALFKCKFCKAEEWN